MAVHRLTDLEDDLEAGYADPPPRPGLRLHVAPEPEVVVRRVLPDREMLAALNGLGAVLAVRLMLLLAVAGAFALAWQGMQRPTGAAITLVAVYAVLIVGPLTWLSTKRT